MVENVLLVEDESIIAIAQAEALTDAGFLVHPVSDGASAIAVARKVRVSAAIIDMGLPDGSGDEVARELRARHPLLPILICTGYDATALFEVIEITGVCIVEKPIDESALIATLREHMHRSASPVELAMGCASVRSISAVE